MSFLFFSEFFAFLSFWFWLALRLEFLYELFHLTGGVVSALSSLIKSEKFWSKQASMEFISNIVCIPRCQTLKVDDVGSLVGSSNAFDFNTAGNLNNLAV